MLERLQIKWWDENQDQAWFSNRGKWILKHTNKQRRISLSLERFDIKACGQGKFQELWGKAKMLLGSIILWSCSSTKRLHAGQETRGLCYFSEKYNWGVGLGAEIFCSFPLFSSKHSVPPILYKFCLFSKGKHECCLENTSQFSREKTSLSRQVLGGRKGRQKVPKSFCRADLSSDQTAGQQQQNQ